METKDETLKEAEKFVRRALSHFPDIKTDEASIKMAAHKASESLRHVQGKEPVAA